MKLIDRIGETNYNNQGLKMWIKDYKNARDIDVEFEDGTIKNSAYKEFKKGSIRKESTPKNEDGEKFINNQGIMDVFKGKDHILYWRWLNMIGRCYNPKHVQYKNYGEKGYTVEEYLLRFSNYISFVKQLPNYDKLIENPKLYQIDKDIKTNREEKEYNRKTISIVLAEENLEEENKRKRIHIYQYDKEYNFVDDFNSITEAENITGIHRGNIARVIRGESKIAGGYIWTKIKKIK
jgi:hypothetical protein